jgi:serine/threonine-protein kinase
VALKVLPPEMAENAERRARFEREAKAVAALDHPNIVTIHSVEEVEGVHFYTMQLVKGKTLTELIPKKGMSLNKLFEAAIQILEGREVKPDAWR